MNRVQTEITLGLLLVLASSTILMVYAAREDNRMKEFAAAQEAQSIEVGASLFENNCSPCHGKNGQGTPGLAPALNDGYFFTDRLKDVGWTGTLEDYIIATASSGRLVSTRPEFVGGGKPAMPAWSDHYGGPLRDDQIRSIARFIMNWQSTAMGNYKPVQVTGGAESDDPVVRGQAIFESSGCVGCHTIEGISTGAVGPNLTHIGTEAATRITGVSAEDYIKQSIIDPNAFIAPQCPAGPCSSNVMPQDFGTKLTEQQINDLVAFLASHK
jgi:mono/diheme cytochrome c family protein